MCRLFKLHSKKTAFGKRKSVDLAPTPVADPTAMKVRQKNTISIELYACVYSYINLTYIPVVPHKAVAEVSRIGNYRRDWLL